MNICLRPLLVQRVARLYSTFVPPQSLHDVEPSLSVDARPKPATPTFYTGRAPFYDALGTLEDARKDAERALRAVHLLPFPPSAREALAPPETAWKHRAGISEVLGAPLTTAHYRRVQVILNTLYDLRRIAAAGQEEEITAHIDSLLELFERSDKQQLLARGQRRTAPLDAYGRTYTLGKRKESAARVWMIAVKELQDGGIVPTTVLVNGRSLASYFPNAVDRQRVIRPFKLAGLFGAFNVFALVRGGGTTGQAGAVAHGIAKGLVAHVPDVEIILRRAKLLRRDPRMVERKKTGLAKARKRYAWVKR